MNPFHPLLVTLTALITHSRARVRARATSRGDARGDEGLTTLEVAVIALGLLLIAAVLVAAVSAAVRNRTGRIT